MLSTSSLVNIIMCFCTQEPPTAGLAGLAGLQNQGRQQGLANNKCSCHFMVSNAGQPNLPLQQ